MKGDINETASNSIGNGFGKGLFAERDLNGGSVIIHVNNPFLAILETSALPTHCYYCLRDNANLKKCTGCQVARYCDSECQTASWRIHKKECNVFARVRQSQKRPEYQILPTPVRGLLSILVNHKTGTEENPKWAGLVSHRVKLTSKDAARDDINLQVKAALSYAQLPLEWHELGISLFCKMKVNSFRLTKADDTPIGLCFEPQLSLANHSCIPNAFITFDGRSVSMRALHPIRKGEQITISYVDPNLHLPEREKELIDRYVFKCTCPRCETDWNVYQNYLESPAPSTDEESFIIPKSVDIARIARAADQHSTRDLAKLTSANEKDIQDHLTKQTDNGKRHNYLKDLLVHDLGHLYPNSIAISPYPLSLNELSRTYIRAQNYPAAFLVRLTLFYHADPVLFPEPWHPVRQTSLYTITKLMHLALHDTDQDARARKIFPDSLIHGFNPLATIIALLQEIQAYVGRSHGSESRFANDVHRSMEEITVAATTAAEKDCGILLRDGRGCGEARDVAESLFARLYAMSDLQYVRMLVETVGV